MSELKCCPFCGEKPKIATFDWGYSVKEYWCYCSSCGCETQKYHSKEDAIEQWNTRTPMDNILEKLEEAEKKGSELIGKPHMDSHVLFGWGCAMKTAIEIVREEGAKNDRS